MQKMMQQPRVWLAAALLLLAVRAGSSSGSSADLQHVVIFMQQNRAFDHYAGTLRGVRGFADRAALPLRNGLNALFQPTVDAAGAAPVFPGLVPPGVGPPGPGAAPFQLPFRTPLASTSAGCGAAPLMIYGPDFGSAAIGDIGIVNGGRFDAWHLARPIGQGSAFFARDDLPWFNALWGAFLFGDQSFASALSMTNPNLLHLFSGSSGWSVQAADPTPLNNDEPLPGFQWETLGETLEAAGVSWRVYQETDNFDDNAFAWFKNFREAAPGSPLFDKGMRRNADVLEALAADVAAGALPHVSIVITRQNVSEHAPFSPALGERYTRDLLQIFQDNPAVYAKTAVLIMYDEGGQFFDHAHTPLPPLQPPRDGASTLPAGSDMLESTFTAAGGNLPVGMGFRVPLTIVSPWTRGGYVFSGVLDHTSPIMLIERLFNVSCPNISPWRRAVSGDMLAAFDFSRPDFSWPALPSLPTLVDVDAAFARQCASNPAPAPPPVAAQTFPTQEPGTRPSRALPYTFLVSDTLELAAPAAAGTAPRGFTFAVSLSNAGKAGAAFLLLDVLNLITQPARHFAVEAGKAVSDTPQPLRGPGGRYAYSLHGPNGFVRQFAGDAAQASAAGLLAALTYDAAAGNVVLQLAAGAGAAVNFTVSDNAYSLAGSPWSVPVPAGGRVAFPVAVCGAAVGCWYDLTVSEAPSIAASGFQRRFMGRMETGADSISDPAMAAGISPNTGRPLSGIAPLVPAAGPLFVPSQLADALAFATAVTATPTASASANLGADSGGGGGGGGRAPGGLSAGAIVGVIFVIAALGAALWVAEKRLGRRGIGIGSGGGGQRRRVLRGSGDGVGEVIGDARGIHSGV
jgi:phospholipase C